MHKKFKFIILVLVICILLTPITSAENNDHIYLNKLGFRCLQNDDYINAIRCFKKSIKLSSEYTVAYNNLGSAYYRMGNYEKAKKYFKEVIKQEKHYVKAYLNLSA